MEQTAQKEIYTPKLITCQFCGYKWFCKSQKAHVSCPDCARTIYLK